MKNPVLDCTHASNPLNLRIVKWETADPHPKANVAMKAFCLVCGRTSAVVYVRGEKVSESSSTT